MFYENMIENTNYFRAYYKIYLNVLEIKILKILTAWNIKLKIKNLLSHYLIVSNYTVDK